MRSFGAACLVTTASGARDEVLTIKEVQWRIRRTELDRWIDAQPRGKANAQR
jgi:hypothetical protein